MSEPYEEWMEKAEDDLKFAAVGLREKFYSQVCFHAQQSIEKILKGALVKLKRPYPKIHGLLELMRKLPEFDLAKWQTSLAIIDGYYVPIRYPDAAPGMKASGPPSQEEAAEALRVAQEIFEKISQFLQQ